MNWNWTLVEDSNGRFAIVGDHGGAINWGLRFDTAISHVANLYDLQSMLPQND